MYKQVVTESEQNLLEKFDIYSSNIKALTSGVTAFVAVLKTGHVQLHYLDSALKQWHTSISLLHVPVSKADITVTSEGTIIVALTQQLPTYTFHTYEFEVTRLKASTLIYSVKIAF